MENGEKKILVRPAPCMPNCWFACGANQQDFGRYGLTKEQAVTNLQETFTEFKGSEVEK